MTADGVVEVIPTLASAATHVALVSFRFAQMIVNGWVGVGLPCASGGEMLARESNSSSGTSACITREYRIWKLYQALVQFPDPVLPRDAGGGAAAGVQD